MITNGATSVRRPRRPILNFLRRVLRNWRQRHQHPFNFYIHLLGIPCAVAGVVLLFYLPWYYGVAALVLGYVLQIAGHRVEGNDVGEWAGVKRLFGMPTVAIAPRFDKKAKVEPEVASKGFS